MTSFDNLFKEIPQSEIDASIERARQEAIEDTRKELNPLRWAPVENGWYVSRNPDRSGLNNELCYTFVKVLPQPIEVSFKHHGEEHLGFAHTVRFQTGYNSVNLKDIHAYSLSYSCVAAQISGRFYQGKPNVGNFGRGLSKAYAKKFTKLGTDMSKLPHIEDRTIYPRTTEEIQELSKQKRHLESQGWYNKERQAELKPEVDALEAKLAEKINELKASAVAKFNTL